MSLLGEIRRRKVFQVAAVYAVVAWLLMQIIDVINEPLGLPDWFDTAIIVALAIGFPIAIILAWAFDLTPQGIKAASDVQGSPPQAGAQRFGYISQGLILLAVGVLVVDQYLVESIPRVRTSITGQRTVKPAHLQIELPPDTYLAMDSQYPTLDLSSDGSRLVFVAYEGGTRRLYVRALAELEARPLPGTEGAAGVLFSPDDEWVAFFDGPDLKKVAVDGGAPVTVTTLNPTDVSRGASWVLDHTIIYSASVNSGLVQVSMVGDVVGGNEPYTRVTSDTEPHAWPEGLPGGDEVLFTDNTSGRLEEAMIALVSLESGDIKTLINGGTNPRYSTSGHILYARSGSVFGVPFDASTAEVTGSEFHLLDGVVTGGNGAAQYAVAADGTLAYLAGPSGSSEHELVWVDRDGQTETLLDNGRQFFNPRFSPDGSLLAISSPTGPNLDVWVLDVARGTLARWTSHPGEDFGPVWGPDRRLAFASEIGLDAGESGPGLAWMEGPTSLPEHLIQTPGSGNWDFPADWTPDGGSLVFQATRGRTNDDIYVFDTETREVRPFLQTPFSESGIRLSPDGQWIAYVSDRSGRDEIYVQAYPDPGDAMQMSDSGGDEPVWAPDGRELFYRNGNRLMTVALGENPTIDPSPPRELFQGEFERIDIGGNNSNYDVSIDGRFVMIRRKNPLRPTVIHIVLNWPETLGVPTR